jgi:hypothetical protein
MLVIVIFLLAGGGLDRLGVALAIMAFATGPFLLLYLYRVTPRNTAPLHGGGFDGASAAFGVLPFEARHYLPTIPPNDDDDVDASRPIDP